MKIPLSKVDKFDIMFERETKEGKHKPEDEPGDDPFCPYYEGHQKATIFEKIFIAEMSVIKGIPFEKMWKQYDKAMLSLWRPK